MYYSFIGILFVDSIYVYEVVLVILHKKCRNFIYILITLISDFTYSKLTSIQTPSYFIVSKFNYILVF
jgi:hypothetical protein